jgi:transglutaminase-like putative cysteine protease
MRDIRTRIYEWIIWVLVWVFGYAPLCSALTFSPLDRAQVMDSARSVTPEKYPNAEVVQLDSRQWITYKTDGTYRQWYETYAKVMTEKGRRRYKSVTSSYTIPYNVTEFKLVEVIRPDGSSLQVDIEKNSSDLIEQSQMDANIYDPNNRILRVSIPEVNVGDTVHFIVCDEFKKTRMPGTFSDYVLFESTDPIKRAEYTVVAPKEKPLQSMALKAQTPGTVTHTKEAVNGEIVYTWVARDVPQTYEEPQMPPLYTQEQRLLVSTIPDWESVSKWYWSLCKPKIESTTPEMEKTVKDLVAGISNPQRKIETIFYWVSQEIRYMGITVEKDAPGYEPHPVKMTFERRAGICRDKAALLVSMLRLAGFEAYPVLIMNGPKKDPEVPQPFFNHAISCVRMPDGKYLLMDATDENTKELFPAYLNDQSYLVASPHGETLLTSPIIPAEQNMMHIETTGTLGKQGDLHASVRMFFEGINDNVYRRFFSQLTPEERRQYFEKIVMRTAPGGILTSFDLLPADMLDTSQRIEARFGFEVKEWAIPGKDTVILPVVDFSKSVGMSNILIGKMGLKKRKYPYVTDVACGIQESFRLDVGDSLGKVLSLPESTRIDNKGATWKSSMSVRGGGSLIFEQTFKMKIPEYTPEEYGELQETIRTIEADNKKMPVFSTARSPLPVSEQQWYTPFQSDALVIDEVHDYDVIDRTSWTETKHVKMKVLTYAGKKNYSDIRIAFNPSWEKVELKKAVVTSPGGIRSTIDEKEVNIMDADWVGDAHRYPASKIMVVSLPGVEEGSTIEYTLVRKKTGRSFFSLHGESCFLDNRRIESRSREDQSLVTMDGVFRYPEPIEKKTVRIRVPEGMKLNISDFSDHGKPVDLTGRGIQVRTMNERNKRVYEFSAAMVPPARQEDYMPPWYYFNPVLFASSGSWKDYAHEVQTHLTRAASSCEKAAKLTAGLVKDTDESTAKIRLIRDFVARNIKDIFNAWHELPLSCITPADRVLSDGYGGSADRAVLLYAMLKSAGFEPELVLASWVSPVDELKEPLYDYPAPHWFKCVLVRVKEGDSFIYLNDTDEYAELGSTGSALHPALVLSTGKFETIRPRSDLFEDRTDVDISIRLSEDGDIVMKQKRTFFGTNYAVFRKQFSEMPPEERKRHHEQLVSSISHAAKSAGEYVTRYDLYPGVEELSIRADSYAVRQNEYLYLKIPGLVNILEGVTSDDRKSPLYQYSPRKAQITVDVTLPEGIEAYEVLPPDGLQLGIGKEGGGISLETSMRDGGPGSRTKVVRVRQTVDIKPVTVPADDYPELLDIQRILSHPKTNLLLLRMKK